MRDRQGNPLRVVWLLGAGFSRSLGGPLLPDLLRQQVLSDLRARYPRAKYGELADACWNAQALFNWGKHKERLWGDAEAFLDFVDCADPGTGSEATLLRLAAVAEPLDEGLRALTVSIRPSRFSSLNEIRASAVRATAAECSWFVGEGPRRPERWAPYDEWLASLQPPFDSIVSFNYDGVIESLRPRRGGTATVILPNRALDCPNDAVPLFKLHGSVDWVREGPSCRRAELEETLGMDGAEFALGIPGRSKREMKDRLFEPLWAAAERKLRAAQLIVFVGYRFPESDGDARRRLLTAVQSNSSPRLCLQVVLGPNTLAPDTVRVRRMLEVCTRRTRIVSIDTPRHPDIPNTRDSLELFVEPLYAEDFLSLCAEGGPLSSLM